MNSLYPPIGTFVKYIRADAEGKIHQGEGQVRAIFLNPDRRQMVQVADGSNVWNVDLAVLNPTPETVKAYEELIVEVRVLTDEGNELVKKTVEEYNAKVEAAYLRVLGSPVDLGNVTLPVQPDEQAA